MALTLTACANGTVTLRCGFVDTDAPRAVDTDALWYTETTNCDDYIHGGLAYLQSEEAQCRRETDRPCVCEWVDIACVIPEGGTAG